MSYTHDPKKQKFYQSKAWKFVALSIRTKNHFLCESCGNKANQVHHKQELDINKINDYDYLHRVALNPDNLELLCYDCHNQQRAKICSDEVYIDKDGKVRLKNEE